MNNAVFKSVNGVPPEVLGDLRVTAYDWHGGKSSSLYSFASTGAIQFARLLDEIKSCLEYVEPGCSRELLLDLKYYVEQVGRSRNAVDNWNEKAPLV